MEDLEQYTRKEDIIITGLKIHRTMAQVVEGESATEEDRKGENFVEKQVVDFLNKKGIDIPTRD